MVKAQSENKKCKENSVSVSSDVLQTAKYGTATKENVLEILLQIEILLYTSNA